MEEYEKERFAAEKEYIPTFTEKVHDTLGGTESFLATAVLARTGGASLFEAAILGSAAWATQVVQSGSVSVSREQVLKLIEVVFL